MSEDVLRLGRASVNITPPVGLSLTGPAMKAETGSDRIGRWVHQPLECRVLYLSDTERTAVIVTLDLQGMSSEIARGIRARIERELAIPGWAVMISCSHTHSVPSLPRTEPATDDPLRDYLAGLRATVVRAVAQAGHSLVPCRVGHGFGECDLAVSRRALDERGRVYWPARADPHAPVDRSVGILRFDGLDGATEAILFSYGCHPSVSLQGDWLGPDYVGQARRVIEQSFPSALAVFVIANGGDVRTNYTRPDGRFRWEVPVSLVEEAGARLGAATVEAARRITPRAAGRLRTGRAVQAVYTQDDAKVEDAEFLAFRIGDAAVVSSPAEVFCEIGFEVREAQPIPVVFSSVTNGYISYVPTVRAYAQGGYEVDTSWKGFGLPAPVREDTHRKFRDGMLSALADAER